MKDKVSLKEIMNLFLKLSFIGFGGPVAHITMMRDEVVVKQKSMSEQHFFRFKGSNKPYSRTKQY